MRLRAESDRRRTTVSAGEQRPSRRGGPDGPRAPIAGFKEFKMEQKLKIAVFIDFDNIEIGVKSTLHREFDVAAVLDALKERGEIVTKFAYANWGRQESATRALSEHAVQMVQRDPSPRGDKNGADINLALDALEMAFTHDHINAFAIVSGDSDFIALVNKLKQYDKRIFVVGGRAFTSTILQKNCHEFVAYESIIDDRGRAPAPSATAAAAAAAAAAARSRSQPQQQPQQQQPPQQQPQQQQQQQRQPHKRVALDLAQAMPLVERALGVLERREVRPQLGLLKSTMLQLDSTFNEKAYGASSFTDFVEKLQKADFVEVTGGEGRYMIRMKGGDVPEKPGAKPEEAIPLLRDVLETHRLEVDNGATADELAEWVRQEHPNFDWREYGFQEFSELLNYAQDKGLVRIQADEEKGLIVYLGAEFHPPAPPPAARAGRRGRGRGRGRAAAAGARPAHRHRRDPDSRAASQAAAPSRAPRARLRATASRRSGPPTRVRARSRRHSAPQSRGGTAEVTSRGGAGGARLPGSPACGRTLLMPLIDAEVTSPGGAGGVCLPRRLRAYSSHASRLRSRLVRPAPHSPLFCNKSRPIEILSLQDLRETGTISPRNTRGAMRG